MEKFISNDFLLDNKFARELYHEFAEKLPLIDFHCHLDPKEIAENKKWENISQVWLGGDHYKWRLMRSNGVDEKFCTGEASDREKFQKFAEAMPYMLRNPMYHWCHLELARFFGIDDILLSGDTAEEVWNRANEVLQNGLSAKECMMRSNVEAVCTTDDPTSNLEYHAEIAKSDFSVKVCPTFRPDKAFAIESPNYLKYLETLEQATGIEIKSYYDLLAAIKQRHDFFHAHGCRVSDYGVDTVWFKNSFYYEVEDTFKKAINSSEHLAPEE
ncbi:MAG: glucuronate isomerase, partial [Opitutales bacterium]|nr:glucuronate isomerase [Opitutales bacterium]